MDPMNCGNRDVGRVGGRFRWDNAVGQQTFGKSVDVWSNSKFWKPGQNLQPFFGGFVIAFASLVQDQS